MILCIKVKSLNILFKIKKIGFWGVWRPPLFRQGGGVYKPHDQNLLLLYQMRDINRLGGILLQIQAECLCKNHAQLELLDKGCVIKGIKGESI